MKTDFEKLIRYINFYFSKFLQIPICGEHWKGTSDSYEFVMKEANRYLQEFKENVPPFNPKNFSENELLTLGFSWWDESKQLFLIPLNIFFIIPDETILTDFNGEIRIKDKNFDDLETRFGVMAYGFTRGQLSF
jgi:hypothetical protein